MKLVELERIFGELCTLGDITTKARHGDHMQDVASRSEFKIGAAVRKRGAVAGTQSKKA